MKTLLTPLLAACVLWGCAGTPKDSAAKAAQDCADRTTKAEQLVAKGKFLPASEKLNSIVRECAGSGLNDRAQYALAESYFGLEDWINARAEFAQYMDQYPQGDRYAEAALRKVRSSFQMLYKPNRDGSYTQWAIDDAEQFLDKFPDSPVADSVATILNELYERQAKDAFDIGTLYLRMGEPQAAAITLKDFVAVFPGSRLAPTAFEKLVEAYVRLDQFDQARVYVDSIAHRDTTAQAKVAQLRAEITAQEKSFQSSLNKGNGSVAP